MRRWIVVLIIAALALTGAGYAYAQFGPCGVVPVLAGRKALSLYREQWLVQFELAQATYRTDLAGPIEAMQAARTEAAALAVPACLQPAQGYLLSFMEAGIAGYTAFMRAESDAVVRAHFAEMNTFSETYHHEVFRVDDCLPLCGVWP